MPEKTALEAQLIRDRSKAAQVSLLVGVVLCGIKMAAWYLTGSSAIMSDALESFINVATALLALVAVWVSARPADDTHPYGHGKIEFFSSGVEGALILLAGLAIVGQSVEALISGVQLEAMNIGLALVAGTGVANFLLGWFLVRNGRRNHSEALVANGQHVLSDAWTSAGIIVGITLVLVTGQEWLDPVCALIAGSWIFWSGLVIVRRSVGMLMDAADPALLSRIAATLAGRRRQTWIAPHRLRAWRSGATIRIDFHLILPFYWSLEQTHEEEHVLHDSLKADFAEPLEVIVHTEPCFPACCHICGVQNCPVRTEDRRLSHVWSSGLLESELVVQTGQGHPARILQPHDETQSI